MKRSAKYGDSSTGAQRKNSGRRATDLWDEYYSLKNERVTNIKPEKLFAREHQSKNRSLFENDQTWVSTTKKTSMNYLMEKRHSRDPQANRT